MLNFKIVKQLEIHDGKLDVQGNIIEAHRQRITALEAKICYTEPGLNARKDRLLTQEKIIQDLKEEVDRLGNRLKELADVLGYYRHYQFSTSSTDKWEKKK